MPFRSLCPDGVKLPPSPDRVTVVPLESSIKGLRDTEKFVDLRWDSSDLVTVVSGGREGDQNHKRRGAGTESRNHSRGSTHIRVERQGTKMAKIRC